MILLQTGEETESPCIKVCKLDTTKQYCIGCHRSLKEIYEAGKK